MDETKDAGMIFDNWADRYQEKYMDTRLYHESFDWFCEAFEKENPKILELGCGPGNITHYLLKKRPDFQILATDVAEKMLQIAKVNNPKAETRKLDIRRMQTLHEKFDGIVCGFCLPYLSPEETLECISGLSNLLNSDGIVYLSTMEGSSEDSGYQKSSTGEGPALFINYYEEEFLVDALKSNDFEILRTEIIYYPNEKGETESDLVILAHKLN